LAFQHIKFTEIKELWQSKSIHKWYSGGISNCKWICHCFLHFLCIKQFRFNPRKI